MDKYKAVFFTLKEICGKDNISVSVEKIDDGNNIILVGKDGSVTNIVVKNNKEEVIISKKLGEDVIDMHNKSIKDIGIISILCKRTSIFYDIKKFSFKENGYCTILKNGSSEKFTYDMLNK